MPSASRYVALLRAINVGGHTVTMADLRAVFSTLGFAEITTFIASGNVRFSTKTTDAAALESLIEKRLLRDFGYDVATFIRTEVEMIDVAARQPVPPPAWTDPSPSLSVCFLKVAPADTECERLLAIRGDDNEFVFRTREIYWWVPGRFSDSTITGAKLERALGQPATIRNVTTVEKIAAICSVTG